MDSAETDWIDKFIGHLEYERRLSPLTCKHYRRDLVALTDFCDEIDRATWADLDSEDIRAFSGTSFRRGLADVAG